MKITDVRTVLLTGPATNDPFLQDCRERRSAAFIEIDTDGHMGNSASSTWDLPAARAVIEAVAPFDLFFFEEPLHCGFAAPNTAILEVPPDFGPLHAEIMGESFQMRDGSVLPPTTAGLGITLTDAMKQRFPFEPGSGEYNSVVGKVMPKACSTYRSASGAWP